MFVAGVDRDFGRGDEAYDRAFFCGGSLLVAIEKGPYHAATCGISDLGTKGGLRTHTAARVLDTAGHPVRGLYAAGRQHDGRTERHARRSRVTPKAFGRRGSRGGAEIWKNKTRIDNPLLTEEDGAVYQHRRWYEQFTSTSPKSRRI